MLETNIILEVAEQLGVPILVDKSVVTVEVQVPSLIDRSEGRTILIEAPSERIFFNVTLNV